MRRFIIALCLTFSSTAIAAPILPSALFIAAKKKKKKDKNSKKKKPPKEPEIALAAPAVSAPPASAPASEPSSTPAPVEDDADEESGDEDDVEEGLGKGYVEPKDEQSRAPKLHPLLIGMRVRAGAAFGAELHLDTTAGLAIGVRLPFFQQALSIAIAPSFIFAYGFRVAANPDVMTLGLLVPIEVAGRVPLGAGHLRVAAAPTLYVGRTIGRRLEENVVSFGMEASVSYLFRSGSLVRVGPEVGYRLLPVNIDDTRRLVHVVEAGVIIELDRLD